MTTTYNDVKLTYDTDTFGFSVTAGNEVRWALDRTFRPYFLTEQGRTYFDEALKIEHKSFHSGIGSGFYSRFEKFCICGKETAVSFELCVWMEEATGDIICEWIPIEENEAAVLKVYWPAPMEFTSESESWYSLINLRQGILIPNNWNEKFGKIIFEGRFGTAGSYMPWFAQVRERRGYLTICETPWNAGYYLDQPDGASYTQIGVWNDSSLGRMDHRRIIRYKFLEDCDYNDICKVYRCYASECGRVRTLEEKAVRLPKIRQLTECSFIHQGIKTYVNSESDFYDEKEPAKNNKLTTFGSRAEEIVKWHEQGAGPVYLHLDGWAEPGYDNNHPDYYPVCREAGGAEEMRHLEETLHAHGDLFGIHDQYRDYYRSAESFNEEEACRLTDGNIPEQSCWAGGPQSYLCTSRAPYYVKRNFQRLFEQGIRPDCAYLDVFTCNEGDECSNQRHRMTRRDSYDYRLRCFNYLESQKILASSEEVNDWAVPGLVFCHYAPYDFMMGKEGIEKRGIPVPLFGLVYHDCLIIPWMMDKVTEKNDYMLYALLNGGAPYLKRDGAYVNIDGAFENECRISEKEQIERCKVVTGLYRKIAFAEMVSHEFIGGKREIQRTIFSDGTAVIVDLGRQEYKIEEIH